MTFCPIFKQLIITMQKCDYVTWKAIFKNENSCFSFFFKLFNKNIFNRFFFSWRHTHKKTPKLSESLSNYLNEKGLLYHYWPLRDLEILPVTEKYTEWLLLLSCQRKRKNKMITYFTTLGMLGKIPNFFKMLTRLEMSPEVLTPKKLKIWELLIHPRYSELPDKNGQLRSVLHKAATQV